MRRLIGWTAGLAGIAALAKLLHKRPQPAFPPAPPSGSDDPAEELRRKLAEARASASTTTATVADDPPAVATDADGDDPEPAGPTIEERRADVHAQAQAAIDAMRDPSE